MARRTLPESTKEGILRDLAAGVNKAVIAKTYGVSVPTVYNFLKRQTVASEAPAVAAEASVESTATAGLAVATVTRKTSKRSVR